MPLSLHAHGFTKSVAIQGFNIAAPLRSRLTSFTSIRFRVRYSILQNVCARWNPTPAYYSTFGLRLLQHATKPTRGLSNRAGDARHEHEELANARSSKDSERCHGDVEDDGVTAPLEFELYIPPERSATSLDADNKDEQGQHHQSDAAGEHDDKETDLETWLALENSQVTRSRSETYRRRLKRDNEDMLKLVERKSSPKALRRLLQPSPSFHLERALSEANDPGLLPRPRPRSVHDLSYRNAKTLEIFNINGHKQVISDDTISLQSITAKYIRSIVSPHSEDDDSSSFSELPSEIDITRDAERLPLTLSELQMLQAAGYNQGHAHSWAKILLQPNIEDATRRLTTPQDSNSLRSAAVLETPWFVMNFLLRRETVTAEALRRILDYAWRALATQQKQSVLVNETSNIQPPSPRMIMTLCVRLVRHARDVWPQALPNITKLFTTYMLDAWTQYYVKIEKSMLPSFLEQLAFKCNRMLSQLSLVGRKYPVLSATHQQRAQFDLIRRMMAHEPPLPITREGHRALTKTLLLLRKTPQERDWALLQARSWPPFKISKTRLDDPKDWEYGTSTAGKSIHFMQGYGYPMLNWDYIAQVYSGWNPDGSPAIQQRALTPAVPTSRAGEPEIDELHAAIISSTRSIPEAWAAFLKFDTPDGKWRAIYMAMFKKLLMQQTAHKKRPKELVSPENNPVAAGDGTEVFPPPSSPLEAIYLPSEPPSVEAFFETLVDRGFPIHGGMMQILVEKAPSFEFGLKVWSTGKFLDININNWARWSTDHLALLKSQAPSHTLMLPNIPNELLVAFIALLTSFPWPSNELIMINPAGLKAGGWQLRPDHTLIYAYQLLMYYNPPHAAAWNKLLKALTVRTSLRQAIFKSDRTRERFWPLVAWAISGNVMRSMIAARAQPDLSSFEYLCDIAHEAAVVVRSFNLDNEMKRLEGVDGQVDLDREFVEAQLLMSQGSSLLRRRFVQLVGLDRGRRFLEDDRQSNRTTMPHHLAIPKAVVLHKYVRALGILGDHEGIFSLVRWMVDAASDLHELQETQLNGRQHMRRLIVALRVWLECPSRDFVLSERGIEIKPATEELMHLVRSEVDNVSRWAGWPSHSDVDKYCRRHQNYFK